MFGLVKLFRWIGILVVVGGFLGLIFATGVYFYLAPKLPSAEALKDVRLQVPLRVYTRDERLIWEFGEKKRDPLRLAEIPETMIKALLATEDERFYEHPGVDWQGLTRAVLHLITTGEKGPGGSTITMQVARNFFLGREKTYVRKANEILLALKIEREFGKDEILELYLNKIFLGHRAYGVGAAAKVYYNKEIRALSLPQAAMIAGLPAAPSRSNPISNPGRAVERRNHVLRRMSELALIDDANYQSAIEAPVSAQLHSLSAEVEAPYVAEMVRAKMEARYGDDAYTLGYKVFTSIDSRLQGAARDALRGALLEYDQRHGFRGAEFEVDLSQSTLDKDAVLKDIPVIGGLTPALITEVGEQSAIAYVRGHGEIAIEWEAMSWARRYISENRRGPKVELVTDVLQPGAIVRVQQHEQLWHLAQVPDIEGAIVAIDPMDGAIRALSGGFDFYRSKFNRAVQAQRQPGSSFKPFIYSAALDHGFTPASLINDAPVVFDDLGLEDEWRPENYSGKFFGPTRIRLALTKSRNLISIRLLNAIGVDKALDYVERFGLDPARLPRSLSMALGSGAVTPLELATGYSVLANGGYRVEPYFIDRIVGGDGEVLFESDPLRVCPECETDFAELGLNARQQPLATANGSPLESAGNVRVSATEERAQSLLPFQLAPRVIEPRNAWLMNSMMRDVVRSGTGRRAMQLGRDDLAGKTGTTNDLRDAWFSGFNPSLVATTWVGFDDHVRALGRRETGARAALPMWIAFMGKALDGTPGMVLEQPEGLVTIRIDPETGRRVGSGYPNAIFETFREEHVPEKESPKIPAEPGLPTVDTTETDVTEQLF